MTRFESKLAQTHVALTGPTRQQVLQLMMTRNSLIFGKIMHPNEFILLDFETIISTYSVVFCASRFISPPDNKAGLKRKLVPVSTKQLSTHLPECQYDCKWCAHSYKKSFDWRTLIRRIICGFFLCLVKETNRFLKYQSKTKTTKVLKFDLDINNHFEE